MTVTFATEWPYIVRAGQGLSVPLASVETVHKVRSSITDGRMAIVEFMLTPRHLAAPLHRHSREDEILFVLAGQIGALLGDTVVQARTGAYVVMPRWQWHTFWNASDSELRLMELIVPGGLELLLDRLGVMIGAGGADLSAIERIGAEHGVEFDFDSVPAICRHFGVVLDDWPRVRLSGCSSARRSAPLAWRPCLRPTWAASPPCRSRGSCRPCRCRTSSDWPCRAHSARRTPWPSSCRDR